MRADLALTILGFSSAVAAAGSHARDYRDGRSDGNDDGHGESASVTTSASGSIPSAVSNAASNSTSGLTGGSVCPTGLLSGTNYMCISAVVNGSTVQYTMQSKGQAKLGWMAMGFGGTMAGSPMVIMWPNSNGNITLSQRSAPSEIPPTVVSNPPRVASADSASSDLTGSQPKLTFTIPHDGSQSQNIIWAFSSVSPNDPAVDATIVQHDDSGASKIDLSGSIGSDASNPATDPNASSGSVDIPLLPYQKMVIAHGVLCTIGFLMLLPAGALLARYSRTFTNAWFTGHWVFQFGLAGPVIIAGVALGINAVTTAGVKHLDDDHKKWGIAIFVLYFVQCFLGAIIHWVKPSSWTVTKKRPVQNYFHAVLGLLVVGLAFYQVRTGFRNEWPRTTSRPPISNAANIVWYVWVVFVPVAYFAGLAFLPKQLRQERPRTKEELPINYQDEPTYRDRD